MLGGELFKSRHWREIAITLLTIGQSVRNVVLQPASKSVVRIPLNTYTANRFSNEVLAIKPAFGSTLVDPDFVNPLLHFFACQHFPSPPVFGSLKLQNAHILAF